ncbi:hypothetical protein C8N32_101353 [Rhodovulum imhoffii]|uniref:Uncharacterized protein n=1 Tax=Rhodovulum imhoffii TaxID=365340 RepID=A0A2T5BWY4_9RHOB|nr:hypothetical protein [Rhodovulum imhoffii]PTN04154.1 hypothetical protein C8N32_101353 [Rhodovulum imhoffii]
MSGSKVTEIASHKREVPAVTLLKLTDVAALPWHEQPERVFD